MKTFTLLVKQVKTRTSNSSHVKTEEYTSITWINFKALYDFISIIHMLMRRLHITKCDIHVLSRTLFLQTRMVHL